MTCRSTSGPLGAAGVLLLAATLVAPALASHASREHPPGRGPAGVTGAASGRTAERLTWYHWGLELFLSEITEHGDSKDLRFCLELKSGVTGASVFVGYPRYRSYSGRWRDAVTRGWMGRDRVAKVTRAGGGRFCFSVLLPHDSVALELPIDEETLALDLLDRVAPLQTGTWEALPRPVGSTSPQPSLSPLPGAPARLLADLRWDGEKPFGDGALDEGEQGVLLVDVLNDGPRVAYGLKVRVSPERVPGLRYPAEVSVPEVAPGEVVSVPVPILGQPGLRDSTLRLTFNVVEPFGHDAPAVGFELVTRGAPAADLVLTEDFAVEGAELPVPRDRIVTLRLRVRNVGRGEARDVNAVITPGEGVFAAHDSDARFSLGDLAPGEIGEIAYRCYANQRAEQLSLEIAMSDARGHGMARTSLLNLPLEDSGGVPRIVRVRPEPPDRATPLPPPPAPLTADIDRLVPQSRVARPHALGVVLGVESYADAPPATYAVADARTAVRYFERALGIPARRIQLLLDEEVTLGQLQRIFGQDGWLARRMREDTEVFVFFAGHGVAELEAFVPYLIPSDGDLNYVQQTGFALDRMIERLAALDARRTTVFIDACFSGLTREGSALMGGARPLVLVPAERNVTGVSLFSAARGSQLAGSLDDQGHGLFSYFLFKGLGGAADLDGDRHVSSAELKLYLEDEVPRAAAERDREQNPSVVIDADDVLVALPSP